MVEAYGPYYATLLIDNCSRMRFPKLHNLQAARNNIFGLQNQTQLDFKVMDRSSAQSRIGVLKCFCFVRLLTDLRGLIVSGKGFAASRVVFCFRVVPWTFACSCVAASKRFDNEVI